MGLNILHHKIWEFFRSGVLLFVLDFGHQIIRVDIARAGNISLCVLSKEDEIDDALINPYFYDIFFCFCTNSKLV